MPACRSTTTSRRTTAMSMSASTTARTTSGSKLNDQKALRIPRHRPAVRAGPGRCCAACAAHFVYYNDHYAGDDERKRLMGNVTFEHHYVNAGFDYLDAKDQTLRDRARRRRASGYSIWATPRLPLAEGASWEGCSDTITGRRIAPTTIAPAARHRARDARFSDQKQNRTIFGVAYWFPHQGNVSTAMLVDYDGQSLRQHHHCADQGESRSTGCSISSRRRHRENHA